MNRVTSRRWHDGSLTRWTFAIFTGHRIFIRDRRSNNNGDTELVDHRSWDGDTCSLGQIEARAGIQQSTECLRAKEDNMVSFIAVILFKAFGLCGDAHLKESTLSSSGGSTC
jgi:hypothetical protein